ncbi:hypothetical protein GCM10028805_33560 [Spirosoma harenae]
MVFRFNTPAVSTSDLVAWPPLRVYDSDQGAQWRAIADLVYLEGEANYTWLQWADGERILMPYTIKRFASKLPANWFIRLHRHYLVNRRFVEWIEHTPTGAVVHLATGAALPVSRRRWVILRKQLTFHA